MSGLPELTEKDMDLTFKLIDRLAAINKRIIFNGIFLYSPYPGTPLFSRVIKDYGYKAPGSLEKWAEFGIYRSGGHTWCDKRTIHRYKTISILTRFPFWKDNFSLNDINNIIGSSRVSKFPFNIVYFAYTKAAMLRWKYKFFRFPVEWVLLEKALEKIRGFI